MNGFIVVDKPAGMSSHDVVAAVRRIVGQKKAGHTGTLDPFATGVLPVALGEATKAITFLDESIKEYRATLRLGVATDTQDCTGTIVSVGAWETLEPSRIEAVMRSFLGDILQLPPMFSALKRNGVPLYKLARRGEEVEREPREIKILSLDIHRLELPEVGFTVRCSRGTYVRTLADDIGVALGCGAHLTSLRRTMSGPFVLENALSLESLNAMHAAGELSHLLVNPMDSLGHLPDFPLTLSGSRRVANGIVPQLDDFESLPEPFPGPGSKIRLSFSGALQAVAEVRDEAPTDRKITLRILRGFNPEYPLHDTVDVVKHTLPIQPPVKEIHE